MNRVSIRLRKFKLMGEELCSLIEKEGWAVRPYSQEFLPFFQKLNIKSQRDALALLEQYLEICRKVHGAGISLKDKTFCMEVALDYYGYHVSPLVYQQLIADDRIVEFYRWDHRQFYRSLNFFEFTSYTIEDIYCRQWLHLYERSEELNQKIYAAVASFKNEKMSPPILIDDVHIVVERLSLERLHIRMSNLLLAPIYQKSRIVGVVAISSCTWS